MLLVLGVVLLLVPLLFNGSDPAPGAMTLVLHVLGWTAIAAGVVALGLRFRPRHRRQGNRVVIWDEMKQVTLPQTPVPSAAPAALPTAWTPRVFELIEWRRFQAVCEMLFAQAGFQIRRRHGPGADDAVDLWLHTAGGSEPVAAAQCKHWKRRPIPVERLRALHSAMIAHGIRHGTFATSSTFTAEALAYGRANGINLQDGTGLLQLIKTRTPGQQAALLALALEGEFWKPSCPNCGIKLAERTVQQVEGRFWGCPNYPKCRVALPMSEAEAVFLDDSRARHVQVAPQDMATPA